MPKHPRNFLSGPNQHDDDAADRRERAEDSSVADQVLGSLRTTMERAQRQGAAPDNVVEQMPSIIAALLDQIVRNVQPRDDDGKVIPILIEPRDVDRLSRSVKTLNDVQQSWVRIGIEAAKAAGLILVKSDLDDDGPRRIAYPMEPPSEPPSEGDGDGTGTTSDE